MNLISSIIFGICLVYCFGLGLFVMIKKIQIKKQIKKDMLEDLKDDEFQRKEDVK